MLPDGSQLLQKETERMKVVPLLVRKKNLADNLPVSTLSARVSCRLAWSPSYELENLEPFVYTRVTCLGVVGFVRA